MFIDAHCHLDMYRNPEKLLKQYQTSNLFIIGVTLKPSHFRIGLPYLEKYKNIRFSLGMHPLYTDKHTNTELGIFKELLDKTSYIGEVGLDFSSEGIKSKHIQINCFQQILENIQYKKKFISIHSRKAEKEVLSMLKEYKIKKAVFHWYTGTKSLIPDIINNGYFFSINPSMINTKSGLNLIKSIPLERILTETDGPYQRFNGKIITPNDVVFVYEELSKIWNISKEEIELNIWDNFKNVVSDIVTA